MFKKGNRRPKSELPTVKVDLKAWQQRKEDAIIWYGHSAYLMQLDGKLIFVDPMLANSYSPVLGIGGRRFNQQIPFAIEDVDSIAIVLITHNHYDHLNRQSILRLKDKVSHFVVPRGLSSLLMRWGIEQTRIHELAWWQTVQVEGFSITGTPAQHFSGRGLRDRNATLWCSYVVESDNRNVYCGGDSGYGGHFAEIGQKYGPFDLAVLECGQYDDRWASVHMRPEETVQAHLDLQSKLLLPVHWAGFTLAFHDWDDPIKRVVQAAKNANIPIATPLIGEPVRIGITEILIKTWWNNL
jgi:L-ascorbate metabolism protein UlaG (beta-lactamase superfamily)